MRQRFQTIFEGMTGGEQRVLLGLIVLITVAVGVRYRAARDNEGFRLIGEYDEAKGGWQRVGDAPPENTVTMSPAPRKPRLVNVNTAVVAELETLPGIGPALSRRVIDYREQSGPFRTVDELDDVSGIGEKRLEDMRPRVTVGDVPTPEPPAPEPPGARLTDTTDELRGAVRAPAGSLAPAKVAKINVNTANEKELDVLPGIGPVTAESITTYRQYNGPFRRIEDLEEVGGIGPVKLKALTPLVVLSD